MISLDFVYWTQFSSNSALTKAILRSRGSITSETWEAKNLGKTNYQTLCSSLFVVSNLIIFDFKECL